MYYNPNRRFEWVINLINQITMIPTNSGGRSIWWWDEQCNYRIIAKGLAERPNMLWFMNSIMYGLFSKELWLKGNGTVRERTEDTDYGKFFWFLINEPETKIVPVEEEF